MDSFFKGKRALVTGAGKGIGRDIAATLYKRGAQTVALSRTQSDLDSLKKECPGIQTVTQDVADWTSTRETVSNLGHFDLLVNNAGVAGGPSFLNCQLAELNRIFDINFKSAFNISQVVARGMVEQGKGGSIVHMSSVTSKVVPLPGLSVYAPTKGALDSLAQAMALELGPHKIRVNCVNPGLVMTNMADRIKGTDIHRSFLERTSMGGHAEVSDVTNAVLFLLSDQAAMVTGTTLVVDGGYSQR